MFILSYLLAAPMLVLFFLPIKNKNRKLFYFISILFAFTSILLSFYCNVDTLFSISEISFLLQVDKYSKVFLILINCTWLLSILYSYEFTKYHFQSKKTNFFIYLNILLSVVMINACAGNLQTLFVFYVLGIPLTYPLIQLKGDSNSNLSSKVFLKQTLLPAFLIFLPAIIFTQYLTGNLNFDGSLTFETEKINPYVGGVLLFMFIIGISKNSVFPFHNWLPKTHAAPAPVSGLIHSVATVKTGSIALIKIAVYIFGLDYVHLLTSNFFTGGWLIYLSGLTAVYTAYKALKTDDLKQRFAYSTVGQLSYIILAILIGTQTGIVAATLHIVTHAIAKSCLFYVAGFYNSVYHTTSIKEIGKIMPSTRFIALVIAVCGLSITGFPFLAGYYSKDLMLIEEWHQHYYASAIFLVLGALINLLYIVGPIKNAYKPIDKSIKVMPIPHSMLLTFIISLLLILSSSFYINYITHIIK